MGIILHRDELARRCAEFRAQGKTIGLSSGVFDILHRGHVEYLTQARNQVDILCVAVNSDRSVQILKGPERPIHAQEDRAAVLAGLVAVDFVFIFDEETNRENVLALRPHVYVKAGDYSKDKLSSARLVEEQGGRVLLLPFLEGRSSSRSIAKVAQIAVKSMQAQGICEEPPQRAPSRAVFLDRDGTLNEDVEYLHEPEKLRLLPGVIEGLQKLQAAGFRLVIVTNQPGIGFGYFRKEDFFAVNRRMLSEFSKAGIRIDKIYFSPYTEADRTPCRKPGTALLERAVRDLNLILHECFVIGDMTSDVQLAKNAGCHSVLLRTGKAGQDGRYSVDADYTADDFLDAVEFVLKEAPRIHH